MSNGQRDGTLEPAGQDDIRAELDWLLKPGVLAAASLLAPVLIITIAVVFLWQWPQHFDAAVERTGLRTAGVALIAATGAGYTLLLSARAHAHMLNEARRTSQRHSDDLKAAQARHTAELQAAETRQHGQIASDQQRADRLHLTQLFDSAADKLGANDDATRTAAVLILERLYNDAATLLTGESAATEQRDSLQRSITETICGYVRERSSSDSRKWHQHEQPVHDLNTGLHPSYRSPASIRTAITVLGRLTELPNEVTQFDLTAAHLSKVRFQGNCTALQLSDALLRDAWFDGVAISGNATFDRTTISGDARFSEVTISGNAWFHTATITGDTWFDGATISGNAWFDGATITGNANFHRAIISGDASFCGVTISGNASFGGATISSGVNFYRAIISGDAWFDGATISGDASFGRATISGNAWFRTATITGDTWFDGATISGNAWFDGATITGNASFDGARITGNASFDGATIGSRNRLVRLGLGATWDQQVVLEGLLFAGWPVEIDGDNASFADSSNDPRNWP